MKIVFKYLKTFAVGVGLAIALLFVQALCDLNLPNYMSSIVDTGIQQNGIEHSSPNAISRDGMQFVKTFVNEKETEKINNSYELVSSDDYKDKYPQAKGDIYILKSSIDEVQREELDNIFGIATWTFINTTRELQAKETSNNELSSSIEEIDVAKLYESLPMFKMIPEDIISDAHKKASSMDNLLLRQSGMIFTKAFYQELGVDLNSTQSDYIFKVGLIMLAIALTSGVATVLVNLLSSRIATGVAKNMRNDLFEKIESFSNVEFDKVSSASLITRCTNDVMQIQNLLVMGIRIVLYSPIMAIGGIILALRTDASMSWIIVLAVVVTLGVIMILMAIAMPKFKIIQKLVDKVNLISREELSGMMVVRAFSTEKYEEERFDKANIELAKTNLFVNRVMVFMQPFMMFVMNGLTVLVVWVGAQQIADSNMQIGSMMAFIQYAMIVLMSFVMLSIMFIMIPRAAVSAQRIKEVMDTEIVITDPENPREFEASKKGLVEFEHVHFRYDDAIEDAVDNVNFKAKPNEVTAIIGSTGSGKTTLANLLMRFFDVTSGVIKVEGVDIREVKQEALHSRIGYIPQKGMLLSGSIESNIKYGNKEASEEDIKQAANIAQATEFIEGKEGKYQSEISQGGKNVSGGQKQRLSIARALAIKPDILLFDDSFSALDFKTDSALRQSIKDNVKGVTMIVVAQRISTIMNADNILVMDKGKIVGQGKHKELLKTCQEYYEIASTQLSKEELSYE